MKLIYFIEGNMFFQAQGSVAVGTPETWNRFQRLVSWLCEGIKQDTERVFQDSKMLIVWEPIGSVRLSMAQDLRAELLLHFPQMEIKLKKLSDFMHQAWIVNQPYAILKDHKLMDKAREKGVRYLIGIF
ncbi:MAG: hypothetical protein V1814_03255 [Candidatus Moraniibacteriota bacterium]